MRFGCLVNETGGQAGVTDKFSAGGNFHNGVEVYPPERDARIWRRRPEGDEDLPASVEAHARGADDILERSLFEHLSPLTPSQECVRPDYNTGIHTPEPRRIKELIRFPLRGQA